MYRGPHRDTLICTGTPYRGASAYRTSFVLVPLFHTTGVIPKSDTTLHALVSFIGFVSWSHALVSPVTINGETAQGMKPRYETNESNQVMQRDSESESRKRHCADCVQLRRLAKDVMHS